MRPEEELRFLILAAQREGNRTLTAMLAPHGLTPSQAEVIRCLADYGPTSLRDLGAILVCESGSPSRLVDTLVSRDLVMRREDPEDRRLVTLTLTPEGKRLDRAVRKVEDAMYERIGNALGATGLSTALSLLRPMVEGSPGGDAITRRRAQRK